MRDSVFCEHHRLAGFDRKKIEQLAQREMVDPAVVEEGLADGSIVLVRNHDGSAFTGVGYQLTTKVNANVGTSVECPDYGDVLKKAKVAHNAGAHTLMDLSTVG